MGKKLIIKGADFSLNGIKEGVWSETWYITDLDSYTPDTESNPSSAAFAPSNASQVQSRTINMIKLKISTPGIISIGVADKVAGGKASLSQTRTLDFSNVTPGSVVTKVFDPITLGATDYPVIQYTTDTGRFMYSNVQQGSVTFYARVGENTSPSLLQYTLCVNWGYGEYSNP